MSGVSRLILLRHARAAPAEVEVGSDHARPLDERGRADAPKVAERLVKLGWSPDLVVLSDSRRTIETWSLVRDRLDGGDELPVCVTRALYHAGPDELADVVPLAARDRDASTVLAIGHNPGWEAAVLRLSRHPATLATGCAALLERSACAWVDAFEPWSWRLVAFAAAGGVVVA